MKLRLTDMALKKLAFPNTGQTTYWDELTPGFGVRCSSKSKSFVVMFGEKRRLKTLGRYPALSLSEARKEAKRFFASHLDVFEIEIEESPCFTDIKEKFLTDCASRNKPRTVSDYTRLLNRHFSFTKPINEITRQEVMKVVLALAATPSEQAHAFVAIRTLMNWCVRHGYLEHSPVPPMSHKTKPRERVLNDDELKAVLLRSKEYPYPFGPIVELLIRTGQRRGEIGALRRSWVFDDVFVFPASITKNGREHTLPISQNVKNLLEQQPEISDLYFPSRLDDEKPFNGWGKAKRRFDEPLGIAPYTLHDLRRTFSSNMAQLGVSIHVTEKLLNHVSGTISGVAAVYNRHSYFAEMKTAMTSYDGYLEDLLNQ